MRGLTQKFIYDFFDEVDSFLGIRYFINRLTISDAGHIIVALVFDTETDTYKMFIKKDVPGEAAVTKMFFENSNVKMVEIVWKEIMGEN